MSPFFDETSRSARTRTSLRGFYGIVDLAGPVEEMPARAAGLGRSLLDGGARVLQLRAKGAGARAMLAAARPLRELCAGARALLVINDRLDVAMAAGADAVHLGQHDLPLAAARAVAPRTMLIGISTHDLAQAQAASRGGADYIGFGPVFATRGKEHPDPVVGLEQLGAVCRLVRIPVVAIGGIDLTTVASVAAAGAAAAALISAVNASDDVTAAARTVVAAFRDHVIT